MVNFDLHKQLAVRSLEPGINVLLHYSFSSQGPKDGLLFLRRWGDERANTGLAALRVRVVLDRFDSQPPYTIYIHFKL